MSHFLIILTFNCLFYGEKGLKFGSKSVNCNIMITALYNRHRICHRCEAGEDEDRRLDAGGGVFVQGDTGHAPHQLLRHGQADQNQDLRPGTLSFQIYD